MKLSLFSVVAAIAILSSVYASDEVQLQKRFITCDNVLAVKVCDKFRSIGTTIQVKADEIETFVTDAYNKGITKADEIKSYVEKELETRILSKSCEELTGKTFCEKLDAISAYMKKKSDELKPYIVKAIMEGKEKTIDIANQVDDYIRNDLMQKKCIDMLTADQCKKIDDIGNALTLKANQIQQALVDSVMKGYNKAIDTVTTTYTNMKKAAENFLCEDLLNPDVCVTIKDYANRLKIGMPKMMNAVRSAIVMGYKGTKGFLTVVYKITDAFIDCEHFLSHENCEKIKSTATKIGAKLSEINVAIRDAVTKGISEAEKIYKSTLSFLKDKFGRKRRSLLERIDLKSKLRKYKEMLKKHAAKADKYIKKVMKGLLEKYQDIEPKLKAAVEKAISQGKLRYSQVKKYIEDLIAKQKGGKQISKRDDSTSLRDLLTKAYGKATGFTKLAIKNLLSYSTATLQTMRRYVQSIIDSVTGTTDKRDVESQLKDEAADKLVSKTFSDIGEKLNDEIDNAVNEIADETDQLISDIVSSERKVQKRFLDVDLKDLKLADFITEVLSKRLNNLQVKISEKSAELFKQIKEALAKAGTNMGNVSKIISDKINEMIEKINSQA